MMEPSVLAARSTSILISMDWSASNVLRGLSSIRTSTPAWGLKWEFTRRIPPLPPTWSTMGHRRASGGPSTWKISRTTHSYRIVQSTGLTLTECAASTALPSTLSLTCARRFARPAARGPPTTVHSTSACQVVGISFRRSQTSRRWWHPFSLDFKYL